MLSSISFYYLIVYKFYYTVLYYTIRYYTILYSTLLYSTLVYYTIPYYTILSFGYHLVDRRLSLTQVLS